jgi:hypothetical protein
MRARFITSIGRFRKTLGWTVLVLLPGGFIVFPMALWWSRRRRLTARQILGTLGSSQTNALQALQPIRAVNTLTVRQKVEPHVGTLELEGSELVVEHRLYAGTMLP